MKALTIFSKIIKALRLMNRINVWQTLSIYFTQPHDRTSSIHIVNKSLIHIVNKSLIHIDRTARIYMLPHSSLEFNMLEDPFKKAAPSKLILNSGSTLRCKGRIQCFESVRIECLDGATLEIGDKSYINHNSEIRCREYIHIGDNCSIAYGVLIQDSDYHTITDENGYPKQQTKPIVLGDNVWIGANVIILKGVTIGEGSIIAAGSVVTKSFPSHVLIGGNPAKVIRSGVTHS